MNEVLFAKLLAENCQNSSGTGPGCIDWICICGLARAPVFGENTSPSLANWIMMLPGDAKCRARSVDEQEECNRFLRRVKK